MYESYTRQALPEKYYRELLGTALCVFNSNNAFVIENILNSDDLGKYNWYELMDKESGQLKKEVKKTITAKSDEEIGKLFFDIVEMRNRIIHSFQITNDAGKQALATKTKIEKGNKQFEITEEYLMKFIKLNEQLSDKLHTFRGY